MMTTDKQADGQTNGQRADKGDPMLQYIFSAEVFLKLAIVSIYPSKLKPQARLLFLLQYGWEECKVSIYQDFKNIQLKSVMAGIMRNQYI